MGDTSSYKYIFICIDLFSNYVIGAASKSRTAKEIINFLRLSLLNYSLISKITVDGEVSLLQNKEFNDSLALYNISKHKTSWASSASNGVVERQMFNVKRSLRILTTCHNSWSMYLPYLIASINNTTNSFGLSATMVTFGEELLPQGSLLKLDLV